MKILTVVGARPQFIKAATVSRVFAGRANAEEELIHTGQHHDANMSGVFFEELGIPAPAVHLGISGGLHGSMTARMMDALETTFIERKPDAVMVYGDTNSTLAGALVAAKLHIPVAHVEAGLRSFNRRMPEEINRVLTDHVSEWLFTPSNAATRNALNEGLEKDGIHQVGDVMFDAALHFAEKASQTSRILESLNIEQGAYILATVHRAENTDDPVRLIAIFKGLQAASKTIPVVLPLHPRTRKMLMEHGQDSLLDGLRVIEPVGYLDMVQLEKHASLVVTDSGGVQKEAFFYGVPCVTLRDETEWVELVELGWNRIVPPQDAKTIAGSLMAALEVPRPGPAQPYGSGKASEKIVEILLGS